MKTMFGATMTAILMLCLTLITLHCCGGSQPDTGGISFEIETSGNEIYFGDSFFVSINACNTSKETIDIFPSTMVFWHSFNLIFSISLIDEQEHEINLEVRENRFDNFSIEYEALPQGKQRQVMLMAFSLPSLDSINSPFWAELFQDDTNNGKKYTIRIQIFLQCDDAVYRETLQKEILIKPRSKVEMAIIKSWYEKTPQNLLPVEKEFFMYRFFIGCFVAACVCGLMFCLGGVAEASMLGSIPDIQCAAPVLIKPIANAVMLLITVAALFL